MSLSDIIASESPVLLDGAMGTQLALAGLGMGGQNCLSHPNAVLSVHKRYAESGCDILLANTFAMNRIYIETHGVGVDVKKVNLSGAKLATAAAKAVAGAATEAAGAAAGRGRYALGDISSTGQLLEPYGDYSEGQFTAAFREQAEYLLAGGVDGFIVETMLDLREALCAVRACRDVSSLPVLATLSFQTADKGGRTIMGNSAEESARALADAGAAAVGVNCGDIDPHEASIIVRVMKDAVGVPVIAKPNAGKPRLVGGGTVFDMTPEQFARGISECIEAGASLVGGCCGTSPEHIRCLADLIGKR